jgi:hypothetical protein
MFSKSADSCASNAFSITPADSNLGTKARALYIGTGGSLAVVTTGGDSVTFTNVLSGSLLPVSVSRVSATGTTATNIIGLI